MNNKTHNRTTKIVAIVLLLIVTATSTGCLWAPHLANIRQDIERQLPGVHFDKEIELTLGRLSLTFARLITAFVPDAHDAHRYLRDVSRVELGVYNADRISGTEVSMPDRLREMQESEGWELAVKVRENNNLVWVLYRVDSDKIKEVFVLVLDDNELVLVKAQGRLERLIAYALSESGAMKNIHNHNDDMPF